MVEFLKFEHDGSIVTLTMNQPGAGIRSRL